MSAAHSLLLLAPGCCLLFLGSFGLGCVSLTPPWASSAQSGGSTGAGTGGHPGFYGAGGTSRLVSGPGGTMNLPDSAVVSSSDGGSESRDAWKSGSGGDSGSRAEVRAATDAGGGAVADAAAESSGRGGAVRISNSDGQVAPLGGYGGAIPFQTGGSGGALSSAGGRGGAFTSTGGNGGTLAPTDAKSGAGGSGDDPPTTGKCEGVLDASICWRLGSAGASCAATCALWGGPSPNASKHVGTAAEGGSLAECQRLFGLFGITKTVIPVSVSQGLGCHEKAGMPMPFAWVSSSAYNDSASSPDASILCGCKR